MNRLLRAAALCLACTGLAACHDDDEGRPRHGHDGGSIRYVEGDGAIDFEGDRVVIVAGGAAARATVGPDGSLRIGDEPVDSGSDARAALRDYGTAAVALKAHAIALASTAAEFGVEVLEDVIRGLVGGDLDSVGERAREGARDRVARVGDLCQRLEAMHRAQQAAAAAAPAFAPYAVLDAAQIRDCFSEADQQETGLEGGSRDVAALAPAA